MELKNLKNITLLCIDDEEIVLNHMKSILKNFVGKVYTAKNGKEGLDIALNEHIDVVITDILMPTMTGIDFLKTLSETKQVPAIITTAHSDKDYLLEAIKLKVSGYLIKPINVKDLLDIIYQISLPILQVKELEHYSNIINTISALVGGKKMLVIKYVLNNLDDNGILHRSYQDISQELNISKPTVVKVFQDLMEANILKKLKNRCYQFQRVELFGVN